ncbi:MAG: hypothetical protein A2V52_07130 [Actinobacteria bacterium RBG_19FT_COMBO_54_7]|nr:MAG: hypothetical protein A2V52_07130 [Actinobacteria bacterium RBG_19FT_COMBO_54_7]
MRVIEKMVEDLNFNIEIAKCPTIRESDGLALSSRNMYLNGEERSAAAILYRSLQAAGEMISRGERDASAIIAGINKLLDSEELIEPEYVEVVDYRLLHPLEELRGEVLIALAARVGKARLIDNLLINLAQSPD